jgi:4-amino-4-deoxy-L-arabinose transferase-like glycosyltransferase
MTPGAGGGARPARRKTPGRITALAGIAVVIAAAAIPLLFGVQGDERLHRLIADVAAGADRENASAGLMVHDVAEHWYQPLAIYPVTALVRRGVPQHIAERVLPAFAAGATAALTMLVASRVTGNAVVAFAAGLLLLITPGFRSYSTRAGADLLLVPCVLFWVLTVFEHLRSARRWLPLAGGLALGAAIYTQLAGVLAVPIFFTLGAALLWRTRGAAVFLTVSAVAAGAALAPAALWILRHPEAYPDTFGRWAIHAAHLRNPLDGAIAFSRWHVMARRVGAYWQYFNPTFLFSREMFGLAFAVLLPFGLWQVFHLPQLTRVVLLAGLVLTPVAAVLLDAPRSAALVLVLLPIGAVISAVGLGAVRELTHRGK